MSAAADPALPSFAGAPFLADPALRRVVAAITADGGEVRLVGGFVRDAVLGEPMDGDLDLATPLLPEIVSDRARAAGLKVVPTGIDHGTVTVVADGRPFEVTTLRRDVATDGRRAEVAFGSDWLEDARRRDFTMNAMSLSPDGTLHDPVGGYADCLARRVRFIGVADERIREDYLRILRFFRFHARFGSGAPDGEGLHAVTRNLSGLQQLSAERIAQEMRKLVQAAGAAETLGLHGRVRRARPRARRRPAPRPVLPLAGARACDRHRPRTRTCAGGAVDLRARGRRTAGGAPEALRRRAHSHGSGGGRAAGDRRPNGLGREIGRRRRTCCRRPHRSRAALPPRPGGVARRRAARVGR